MRTQTQSPANSTGPTNARQAEVNGSRERRIADREITLRSIDWDRPAESRPSGTHLRSDEAESLGHVSDSLMTYGIESIKGSDSRDVLVSAVRSASSSSTPKTTKADPSLLTFQVTLRPEQLARLWLREPSLTPSNVLVWSEREDAWVSALKIPEVSEHITRARIESVRMWSVLCASRPSATVAPPERRSRFALSRLSAFAQIITNRNRRIPVRNLRLGVETAGIGMAHVRPSIVPRGSFLAAATLWYTRLANFIERLVRYSTRRARRNAGVVSLVAYFSISSVASAFVVSRLVELRQHHEPSAQGVEVHGAQNPMRHAR